jgi:hypothetical protein
LALPQFAFTSVHNWSQPPPFISNIGPSLASRQPTNRIRCAYLNEIALFQGQWDDLGWETCDGFHNIFSSYLQPDLADDAELFTVTDVQPHILGAISAKNEPDALSFNQAINSPNAEQWLDAMEAEMNTLEVDLSAWQLVRREAWMNVLCNKLAFDFRMG